MLSDFLRTAEPIPDWRRQLVAGLTDRVRDRS
jgi:hypothetical protein